MNADFKLAVDPSGDLVRIEISGFFNPHDIARFKAARDAAHMQLRTAPNRHVTLVDMRGMRIQSQDAVGGFSDLLNMPGTQSRRIAFVVEKSLARMQVQRAAAGRRGDAAFFTDIDTAVAWLKQP